MEHSLILPLYQQRTLYRHKSSYKKQIIPQLYVTELCLRNQTQESYDFAPHRVISYIHQISKINRQSQYDDYQQKLCDSWLSRYGKFMDKNFETLKSQSNWLLAWNAINFILIQMMFLESLFVIFIISLISDKKMDIVKQQQTFCYIAGVIFLIDMIFVRPRIAYEQKGKTVREHRKILQRYLAQYFTFDLLTVSTLLISNYDIRSWQYIRIIVYVKLFSMIKIMEQIHHKVVGHSILHFLYKFFKLIFFVLFCSWIAGCIYVGLDLYLLFDGGYYYKNGFLWITSSPKLGYVNIYQNFEWYVWFQYGLFMVMQMVRGCGYGTPSPRSPLSILFYNIADITITGLFAFYVYRTVDMFTQLIQEELAIKAQYLNFMQIKEKYTMDTFSKISYHYFRELSYQKQQLKDYKSLQLSSSQKLSVLMNYTCKSYFTFRMSNFIDIFDDNTERQFFKMRFATIIKFTRFHEGRKIFQSNEWARDRLYLSQIGKITISRQQIGYSESLTQWSIIGAREFYIDRRSQFDVVSNKTGIVQYIKKQQFMPIVKQFRRIYQKYFQVIHLIRLGLVGTEKVQIKCCFCSEYHLYQNCHLFYPWKRYPNFDKYKKDDEYFVQQRSNRSRQIYKMGKILNLTQNSIQVDSYSQSQTFSVLYNI